MFLDERYLLLSAQAHIAKETLNCFGIWQFIFPCVFCYKQPQTFLYSRSKTHYFCHWDALWWLLLGDKSLYTFRLSLAFYDAAHYVLQYLSTVSLPSVYYDRALDTT